ncbi:MAG: DUF7670 domain-containing protein [Acidobacteriota bacterium]
MTWTRKDWIVWTPRVLAILFACFISLFALDVFVEGRPWTETLVALLMHLIPTYVLILILVIAWRRPWVGAAAYTALALAYAIFAIFARRHATTWILGIVALPLLVIACLFWLSWRTMRAPRADA